MNPGLLPACPGWPPLQQVFLAAPPLSVLKSEQMLEINP